MAMIIEMKIVWDISFFFSNFFIFFFQMDLSD